MLMYVGFLPNADVQVLVADKDGAREVFQNKVRPLLCACPAEPASLASVREANRRLRVSHPRSLVSLGVLTHLRAGSSSSLART